MALPKEVFVREDEDTDGTIYYGVYDNPEDAIEDDGPTIVGKYALVSSQKLEKVARVVEPPKKRRAK